jgi:hypothetical protein
VRCAKQRKSTLAGRLSLRPKSTAEEDTPFGRQSYFLALPTAQDHLGNQALGGALGIPYAFDVPGWDIGFQHSVVLNRDGSGQAYHYEIANSVSIGHAVVGRLSCYVEFFSQVSTESEAGRIGTVDTWLTYQINRNVRLDGGLYIGVTAAADSWHPWLGMTWRY